MADSGYCDCACRDCLEVAIGEAGEPALCLACEEAGCDEDGCSECDAEHAYDGELEHDGCLEHAEQP